MKIGAVILAAGDSSRMEHTNKLLLPISGRPMIYRIASSVITAGFTPIHVVIGSKSHQIQTVIKSQKIKTVMNKQWRTGIAGSIIAGVKSLPQTINGVAIIHGDMPLLVPYTLKKMMLAFETTQGEKIIYPIFESQQGNPVLFPKSFFPHIFNISGDNGCKSILKTHPDKIFGVEIDSEEVLLDCDTDEDYHYMIERERIKNFNE
ncbi:MAG: nucleotidyltransferase family protein [Candidatus Marinimicrobia bacterium]|nr:nucleotidyltransferase family protein [Candidatus Neomarinimicrobiota bacterium]